TNLLVYLDGQGRAQPITSPDQWCVRRDHILASMQLVMGALPDRARIVPPAVEVLDTKRGNSGGNDYGAGGYVRKKITFLVEKDDRRSASLLFPDPASGQRLPAMLSLHPTYDAGKDEVVGISGNPNWAYAAELADRGYVVLAPDYPNMGEYRV